LGIELRFQGIKNLVLLQKRIIRIIARDKYYDHTHKRFIELGIMKFENIYTYTL